MLGESVQRLEDPDLLAGRARFVDDIHLPGMLEACFVRSPHAHALIGAIDKSAAAAMPGVVAVIAFDDLKPHLKTDRLAVGLPSAAYRQTRDRPVLAHGETVHVGEAIALVIADTRYRAEDAAAAVAIEFEPLPPIADCRKALEAQAPRVHQGAPHNLLAEFLTNYGDVERAFADAPHTVALSLWQHRGGSHSLEGRGCVAWRHPLDDLLTLWSSTQTPHAARRLLSDITGRPEDTLRVVTPDIGGGFGPKLVFYPEEAAVALAALILDRPVKWIEDRREHFSATTQERDQYWDVALAFDTAGRILGVKGDLVHDHGAYTARGVNLAYESAQTVTLPYEVPAYRLAVKLALTNKVPVSPVRGAGHPQGVFAMERLLDKAARVLKLDRAEIRRRNLIAAERMPCAKPLVERGGHKVLLDSGDYPACMEWALDRAGWRAFPARQAAARSAGQYLGMGLANFVKGTARAPFESARLRINPSGRIEVASGAAAMGQGTRTMLAQIAADAFGVKPCDIAVTIGDTQAIPLGLGAFNSRQTVLAGSSLHQAAKIVRAKALEIASHLLEAAPDDLECADGVVRIKGVAQKSLPLGTLARAVAGVTGVPMPPGIAPGLEATEAMVFDGMAYANGTAVVEVEVDPATGHVALRKIVIAHDCGRILNPAIVDGQIIGGAVHGLGNALYEWMGFDEAAQPITTNFGEYLLAGANEVPHIEILHRQSPTPLNPLGVKGVGECGVLPMPAAIIAAVEDALSPFNVEIAQTPIRPHEIVALVNAAKK